MRGRLASCDVAFLAGSQWGIVGVPVPAGVLHCPSVEVRRVCSNLNKSRSSALATFKGTSPEERAGPSQGCVSGSPGQSLQSPPRRSPPLIERAHAIVKSTPLHHGTCKEGFI
ncbi:hypothetical protein AAFF_G00395900 [Aldrovandia affinis]|uniref:Uncharacterized protein n=1 Tax=Aldrovandia affinis TaxID=143900 RepID=A0AAD7WKL0_9TELE|nr:hypothetical protein AAFF_G00395900 [Aldrovandia affinis]